MRVQEHLQVAINPMETGDMYKVAMEKIAPFIYHDAEREFGQYCQIHRLHGVTVIQKMLEDVMHQPMAWPTVFGTLKTLPSFWDASPPASPYSRERLILPPLMFVRMEATKLCLAMDARWILMVGAIAGCKPCQAARHSFVSMWVKHFYKWCVPRCLTYGEHLITGAAFCVACLCFVPLTGVYQVYLPPRCALGFLPRASFPPNADSWVALIILPLRPRITTSRHPLA